MYSVPKTRKDPTVDTLHGTKVPDPYRWLEDSDTTEAQEWLRSQSARSEDYFKASSVRDELRSEFKTLTDLDTIGTPRPRNGRYFFYRRKAGEDMEVFYVKEGLDGEPRVLINPNTLSSDRTTTLSGTSISRNGKMLAYMLSKAGNDKSSIHVMNVETGEILPDTISDDVYPDLNAWNFDGTGFWYRRRDPKAPKEEAKFHKRVFFHLLGDSSENDEIVFGEGLERESSPNVSLSHDGRYLHAHVYGQEEGEEWNEIFLKDLEDPEGEFVQIVYRKLGSEYHGHIHRGMFYLITNENAPRWKVLKAQVADIIVGKRDFVELLPETKNVLRGISMVRDKIFVNYLEDVHSVIREYDLDGQLVRDIPLPTVGSAGGFSDESEGKELFFMFDSFVYPPTTYRLDLDTGKVRIFEQMNAPFDVGMLQTDQIWYPSKDGTMIPMFLVFKKGIKMDGNNPTMLYGYGGFDISLEPYFMTGSIPFIERGGIYAIANLRGGGEFGREWHEAGMKKNKQNVFDDFIAAVEWLVREKYTRKERLAVMGGSNGGLLVTAILTQRPDLVQAVVAHVPVTDMLRFHLHHGGRHWIPDYGDPDDPDMFEYLLGYSPYHNVHDGEHYPATLIMTSDGDDRVHPLHSYKMAARLQEANGSEEPILLRVELKAGHSGASSVSKGVEQLADEWTFVLNQLGMI